MTKPVWRLPLHIITGILTFSILIGCPSSETPQKDDSLPNYNPTEDHFFIHFVVLPKNTPEPQNLAAIETYSNSKKRSLPLSRLRKNTGADGGITYFADAALKLGLRGTRYVTVIPGTVHEPDHEHAYETIFYMPGSIGPSELRSMGTASTTTLYGLTSVDAHEVFLNPGQDYVVYWTADYYPEGQERVSRINFRTYPLDEVGDDWEDTTIIPQDEALRTTTLYRYGSGPLYKHGVDLQQVRKIIVRKEEAAILSHSIHYRGDDPLDLFYTLDDYSKNQLAFYESNTPPGAALLTLGPEISDRFIIQGTVAPVEDGEVLPRKFELYTIHPISHTEQGSTEAIDHFDSVDGVSWVKSSTPSAIFKKGLLADLKERTVSFRPWIGPSKETVDVEGTPTEVFTPQGYFH